MSTKPVLYIVPGAWQLSTVWSTFASIAKEAGYPVVVNQLPTVGSTNPPLPALPDDVVVIQNDLRKLINEEGKEVVLIGHSSGGLVASCAAEGFDAGTRKREGQKGGVLQVIFLAAFAIEKGHSMLETLGKWKKKEWFYVGDEGDRTRLHEQPAIDALLNDLAGEEQKYWGKQVAHTSLGLFSSPATFEPWSNVVSCSYIFCERDKAVLMDEQKLMRERLGPDAKEIYLDAGHCPYLSMPRELLRAVEALLA